MRRALALAARGRFTCAPNPRVGAVVVSGGRIVGEGWHQRAGEPHAEVHALTAAGGSARGATLYVTLEPCAHHGRTPPCVEAILAAGIARVVACHRDPDPRTAGRGFERLAAAAVEVIVGPGAAEAIEGNLPFLVSRALARPAVTLKWAASLDGRIATAAGESRWITGALARRRALELREEHDAVLVGSGTVLADDPRLNRRLGRADSAIVRVILDRRARTPPTARLFSEAGQVLVYTEAPAAAALRARGAEVVVLPSVVPGAVLADLAARGIQSVLVEGGAGIAGAFVDSGLWDRLEVFVAPLVVGGAGALPAVAGSGWPALAAAARVERLRARRAGEDLQLSGVNRECSRVLSSSVGA